MEVEYIKREDAKRFLFDRLIETANNNTGYQCDSGIVYQDAAERIRLCWINEIPAADVVERKHGKWERNYDSILYWWECSECHHDAWYDEEDLTNFCPNCGARMESEGE